MKNFIFILVNLAAAIGLAKAGYHFVLDNHSIVLSGYFQTSLLFILLSAFMNKTRLEK